MIHSCLPVPSLTTFGGVALKAAQEKCDWWCSLKNTHCILWLTWCVCFCQCTQTNSFIESTMFCFITSFQGKCRSDRWGGLHQGLHWRPNRHGTKTIPNLHSSVSPCVDLSCFLIALQIYSSRDLEDNLNKIREICSDDKHDWDQRANAVSTAFVILIFIVVVFVFSTHYWRAISPL